LKKIILSLLAISLFALMIGNVNAETCTLQDEAVYSSLGAFSDTGTFKTKVDDNLVFDISRFTGEITVSYRYLYRTQSSTIPSITAQIHTMIDGRKIDTNGFRTPWSTSNYVEDKSKFSIPYTFATFVTGDELKFNYENGNWQVAITDIIIRGTCTNSGVDPYEIGTCVDSSGEYTDTCTFDGLIEYYFNEGKCKSALIEQEIIGDSIVDAASICIAGVLVVPDEISGAEEEFASLTSSKVNFKTGGIIAIVAVIIILAIFLGRGKLSAGSGKKRK